MNIEKKYSCQFLWEEPVEYKGITLYPVMCKDIQLFFASVNCLLYDPLRYDSEISTLPRLYFLTDIINHTKDDEYVMKNTFLCEMFVCLQNMLNLVLGENQKFDFVQHNNRWFLQIYKFDNNGNVTTIDVRAKDFNIIREIILHQNGVEYDDTFIHEDIRQFIKEQETRENNPEITIEDYINAFISLTHWKKSEIKEISLRQFNGIIDKSLSHDSYNMQMSASMSGFVSFKGKINHWLSTSQKNQIYEKYFKEVK